MRPPDPIRSSLSTVGSATPFHRHAHTAPAAPGLVVMMGQTPGFLRPSSHGPGPAPLVMCILCCFLLGGDDPREMAGRGSFSISGGAQRRWAYRGQLSSSILFGQQHSKWETEAS